MKYRVKMFVETKEIISDEIWYGNSVEDVKSWVELAINDIITKINYKNLYYEIDKAE